MVVKTYWCFFFLSFFKYFFLTLNLSFREGVSISFTKSSMPPKYVFLLLLFLFLCVCVCVCVLGSREWWWWWWCVWGRGGGGSISDIFLESIVNKLANYFRPKKISPQWIFFAGIHIIWNLEARPALSKLQLLAAALLAELRSLHRRQQRRQ